MSVVVARVYDAGAAGGGHRVLVDRLWPRGVARAALAHDEWAKDLAPSDALRRWYGHDPARFAEFARRYRAELEAPAARQALAALARRAGRGRVTLLTATRDVEHSGAAVLRAVIEERRRR
ncbi:MAG TPA: DUF488 family protein, partial [Acidimicrobiales bacterium]|nr:DUF488 family protein [Acidimicrobiales bacterium]